MHRRVRAALLRAPRREREKRPVAGREKLHVENESTVCATKYHRYTTTSYYRLYALSFRRMSGSVFRYRMGSFDVSIFEPLDVSYPRRVTLHPLASPHVRADTERNILGIVL